MQRSGGHAHERILEMTEEQSEREVPLSARIPQRIGEGMPVYDRDGEAVGIVNLVYLGGASEEAIDRVLHPEKEHSGQPGALDWSAFDADNVPNEMRARLMSQGYIVIDGPDLTGVKRYIGPEQIEGIFTQELEGGVINDAVRLRLTRAELLGT
jgi:hypothetical protein